MSSSSLGAESTVSSLPPSIPLRREGGSADAMSLPGDVAWLVVAALMLAIAVATWWGRKKGAASDSGRASWKWGFRIPSRPLQRDAVERVSSTRLSPRHSLHVVVWDGRRLLIGCSDHSMRLISEAPAASSAPVEDQA